MGQTVVEKIAQSHMARGPRDRQLRAGDFLYVRPRHVMTHDNTAPAIEKFAAIGAPRVRDPAQPVFVLDHDIQNRSAANLAKYAAIEAFAKRHGIDFHPAGTGVGHQVMIERQYVVPGAFVVASDSHANMYGGMGALGTPVVRSDAAAIWACGAFWWQVPRTVLVELHGELRDGATGKDVILALCGLYDQGEVLNAAVEFGGSGAAGLSLDARLTIANMTTEWGALCGWFPIDETTLAFVEQRRGRATRSGAQRVTAEDVERWRAEPVAADDDAAYAGRITLDLSRVTPHVSGPDSVETTTPLAELVTQDVRIHKAYLVSCVNSRLEDLAAAAAVLRGRKIADGVELYVAAASREVQRNSERTGAWQALLDAGARALPPGCGPCIGLGAGLLEAGEVGISATNRNFKGRMGSRDARCYLAGPAVVAASAVAGRICGPAPSESRRLAPTFETFTHAPIERAPVGILPGFPERLAGRLVLLPRDSLDTDGMYGKEFTYRDDMTPEKMADVVFENYDPQFAARTATGDIVIGGRNFGSGSSREQAVTALQARGIAMVVAGSYGRTYLRNAYNNGFPCIECPELVARVRELLSAGIEAGEKTLIPGDTVEVDFASGTIAFRGETFRFPALERMAQRLIAAGGLENHVRRSLGLRE
ncbi:MAG: homoaconitase [bacterium]|nr:homoaconitase [bacterium]